jgi:hypothetical protein
MIEIESSLQKLQSIHESERGAVELIAMGNRSVPALRRFLFQGKPSTVFQPRMNAVEALARLGARDVLLEFVKTPIQSTDPAVRFGEEAVLNTAVRELAQWRDVDVATAIMDIIRERTLPGACEAAGRLRLISAAPYLVDALADDVSRPPAMEALRCMLPDVAPLLIEATLKWSLRNRVDDDPISHRKAQAAVRLLSESDLSLDEVGKFGPLLDAEDPDIVACAARILLKNPDRHVGRIASAMISALPNASWFVRDEIRDLLTACGPDAIGPIEAEIHRRTTGSNGPARQDTLLPMVVNLERRIREECR